MSSSRYEVVLLRAMEAESQQFRSCCAALASGESEAAGPEGAACSRRDSEAASVAAAAIGAAARFVRDHGSLADERLKRLAAYATTLVDALPPDLHLLFQLHHVDGYPLSVYATATDMNLAEAAADYRNLVLALTATNTDWCKVLQGTALPANEPREA